MRTLLQHTKVALKRLLLDRERVPAKGRSDLGSLAYRKNRDAIKRGQIPDKYLRVLDLVPGDNVLELGAAEGVLSLLLAQRKKKVVAVEINKERHEEAKQLQHLWADQGLDVSGCQMVLGNIKDRLDLLQEVDTLVAVRSIYYLRSDIEKTFDEIATRVGNVVLCGNKNRARTYFEADGNPSDNLGKFNYYASLEGMRNLLIDRGYRIVKLVEDGDPIVIGVKDL